MYINTNVSSIITRNYLRMNNSTLEKAMERLSSGKRINGAADDAAGLAIATRMTAQVRGMDVATRNAQDGISLIQTAESALGTVTDILQRVRELAVQADNGTYGATDKQSIQDEIQQLVAEIDHIATTLTFNGISLLDGSQANVTLHISDKFNDTIMLTLTDVRATVVGLGAGSMVADIDVVGDAQMAISIVDSALDTISGTRADFGAIQNRLDFIIDNLQVTKQNTEASRSRIEDADMAAESSNLTRAQILAQSSMAMLQKANQNPQQVLQLLQG